ncbi:glycine--tRNA ligase beta subunit [endosymbiont of Sipalinus gigas]|uniref:glycine--tRNA ligase subunit beta n=1 Tax=endosymbiont of Sipalinus gigas TaxID=1972134 RepID=UPI000DC70F10|nr:glycine--tRNA ligase subunit beta [endosymbiont of Sipalinus gigas]BBA85223.1 glycine--tRNA ligase beta subunit [endosymbiont of Sipalinus gigas]
MNNLLIELGVEYIPSKYLKNISKILLENINNNFIKNNLIYSNIEIFETINRIGFKIINIKHNNIFLEKKGPNTNLIYNNNIINNWIKKNNINNLNNIKILIDKNGSYLFSFIEEKILLNNKIKLILYNSLINININEKMNWNKFNKFKFIRPIRNIVLILNNKVLNLNFFDIKTTNITYGNNFFNKKKIIINDIDNYSKLLYKNKVISNYDNRKKFLLRNIKKKILNINGYINFNNNLLDIITSSTEYPIIVLIKINFYNISIDIIKYILEEKFRCFIIYDIYKKDNLLPYIIYISNTKSININILKNKIKNNIESYINNINTLINKDLKKNLIEYLYYLKNISFIKKENLLTKIKIIEKLSLYISKFCNSNIYNIKKISLLFKCDLVTELGYFFPKLSCLIGKIYLEKKDKYKNLSHYLNDIFLIRNNKFIIDEIRLESCIVYISDELSTIVSIYNNNIYIPKGNKDFLLIKNKVDNIISIIINKKILISLEELINKSIFIYNKYNKIIDKLIFYKIRDLILSRFELYIINAGYNKLIIKSIINNKNLNYILLYKNLVKSINKFFINKKIYILISAYKRITNLIKLNNKSLIKINLNIKKKLINSKLENKLFININNLEKYKYYYIYNKFDYIINDIYKFSINIIKFLNMVKIFKNTKFLENRVLLLYKSKNILDYIFDISLLINKL